MTGQELEEGELPCREMDGTAAPPRPSGCWIELEIADLEPADATAFLADLGLEESGLDRVIRATYDLLGYMSFFTVGEDECRAWSIPRNLTAPVAAGEIHSDIQRGFIRAEVVGYDALIARGSMAAPSPKSFSLPFPWRSPTSRTSTY